ncbi:MAG: cupin domain-containing protein [Microthrixaceae bacterium]
MHITKEEIPVRIDAPGAVARQFRDFGTAGGRMGAEYFSLAAGADLAPLLEGLEDDSCHSPHWGYLIEGDLMVTYNDGDSERCVGGDLFYWPPGHSVRVSVDAELVLFSPQEAHGAVLDHIKSKLATL